MAIKRRTITIAGKKYIYIPGDKISKKEFDRQFLERRISDYKFDLECIRTDEKLTEEQKKIRSSCIEWRLNQLLRERERS